MSVLKVLALSLLVGVLGAQTPTVAAYEAAAITAFASVRPTVSPSIALSTASHPGDSPFFNVGRGAPSGTTPTITWPSATCNPSSAGSCTFDDATALNAWTDAMVRKGGTTEIAINIDPGPFVSASEYSGGLTSDCAAGAKISYLASAPGGSGFECKSLVNLDSFVAHAHALGLAIRIRPTAETIVILGGLTSGSTMNDYSTYAVPLYKAIVARYQSHGLTYFTIIHEACGIFSATVPFTPTVASVKTFVNAAITAITAIPSSIPLGAAVETEFACDATYLTDATNGYLTISGLSFIGVDLYANNCLASHYVGSGSPVTTAHTWATLIIGAGKSADIEESVPPRYLTGSGSGVPGSGGNCPTSGEADALIGSAYIQWQTDGIHQAWFLGIVPAMATYGYRTFSFFGTPDLVAYSTDSSNANLATGTWPKLVMADVASNSSSTSVVWGHLPYHGTALTSTISVSVSIQ